MQIGELNTRITIKHYNTVQDDTTGKINSTLAASWDKWAKVVQNSGSRVLDQAAIDYRENFTITVRYEASRPTGANYNINYKGKEMKIHSVVKKEEGFIWFEEINAFL